jgi:hypothetical protein
MPDEMQENESTGEVRNGPRVSRITIALVFLGVAIVGGHTLNRSGFCYSRFGWVSNDEKLALAITAYNERPWLLTAEARSGIAKAYLLAHPECCRVYQWNELAGDEEEFVSAGIIPRPTYITVQRYGDDVKNSGGLTISSCADFWTYWDRPPFPIEWYKEKGAP